MIESSVIGFFMFLSQALGRVHAVSPEQYNCLVSVLEPALLQQCLENTCAVTLRKRRLSMEMMIWCVVGMALYRHVPMSQIVNHLDVLLSGKKPFEALGAVVQAQQRLGEDTVREVFRLLKRSGMKQRSILIGMS